MSVLTVAGAERRLTDGALGESKRLSRRRSRLELAGLTCRFEEGFEPGPIQNPTDKKAGHQHERKVGKRWAGVKTDLLTSFFRSRTLFSLSRYRDFHLSRSFLMSPHSSWS